ncbi:MAG: hypothetical protein ACRDF0_04365 [Candidatus Limnocylindria bacterium]
MRAVVIGAGKLGCGFLLPLFVEAGWEVVLAVRTEAVAGWIRSAGPVRVRTSGRADVRPVRPSAAVAVDAAGFDRAVAEADLVVTAVGADNALALAPALARAIAGRGRDRALDIWTVENRDVAPSLERAVAVVAGRHRWALPPLGFAGGVASIVVAHGRWSGPAAPEFICSADGDLLIEATRLVLPLPRLPGVRATFEYRARLRRKLFTFNLGHAVCAYLGALHGHRSIHEAAADPRVRPLVADCLRGSWRAWCAMHPAAIPAGDPVDRLLERYDDDGLEDPVARVARDPLRKLAPDGALGGAVTLVTRAGGDRSPAFALAIAAALAWRHPEDAQARRLATLLGSRGVASVLREVCGIDPAATFARRVAGEYHALARGDGHAGRAVGGAGEALVPRAVRVAS